MASTKAGSAAADAPPPPPDLALDESIEHAKRAFALKKFEQAVGHYAAALELITKKCGEHAPETADLYFSYGRALLENAIAQSSVLGRDQPEDESDDENQAPASGHPRTGPILSFSGDAEEVDEGDDDPAVNLFAQAAQDIADAEREDEGDEDDEAEPEDDFNAAWEVLDLARAVYEKQKDETDDDEVKLKLADTYIALGDVSLETEKFEQAIEDYGAGLAIKLTLLPISSRHIAEAQYKLCIVLDLTSGRLADAIVHAEKALESVESRLAELRNGLSGQLQPVVMEANEDPKGKGKATGTRLVRDDLVQNMSPSQIEAEIKELSGLRDDLALKVEELKTTPNEPVATSAPALAAQALDEELNTGAASSAAPAQAVVNDLTAMVVKKKKKAPAESAATKRKADDAEAEAANSEKKARLDTPGS